MYSTDKISKHFKSFVRNSINSTFKIAFDNWTIVDYHISFNYDIEGKSFRGNQDSPLFKIPNYSIFIDKLTTLINMMYNFHLSDKDYFEFNDENFIDYLFVSCFSNMSESDLNNPLNFLDRMIEGYKNTPSLYKRKEIGETTIKDKQIKIYEKTSKNIATMEAPTYKQYSFTYNGESFLLPKIHYYIANGKCYIMAIQSPKKKQDNYISKLMDRYFRKFDKGLEDIERSAEGEIGTPKDISPNALAALTLFVADHKDIKTFCFPDYLPLRYTNKVGSLKSRFYNTDEADRIQANLTNKLLLTGVRLCHHFKESDYSFDTPNYLEVEFNPTIKSNDNIIFDLYNCLSSNKKNK